MWLQQLTSTGIPTCRHMAAPDTQWQNGFCERHWGHIKQMAHKMLVNARRPLQFLFYALQTACYIHARLPHSGLISSTGRMSSPYERQIGVPPRISQIRVFGCPVIYRMHKTLKWETSGRRGVVYTLAPHMIWGRYQVWPLGQSRPLDYGYFRPTT